MATIVIKGIAPYDGKYDLDQERAFNAREWRWIKKVSGYMPFTIKDGFDGGDPDLVIVLAVIAMCRNGKIDRDEALEVAEVISEAPVDGAAIYLVGDEVGEDDVDPPVLTSGPDDPSLRGSLEKQNSSGQSSTSDSGTSDVTPPPTTLLRSGTSSESPRMGLAS